LSISCDIVISSVYCVDEIHISLFEGMGRCFIDFNYVLYDLKGERLGEIAFILCFFVFGVPGISDGISMGYDAMRHSLVSRDTGALSIINHISGAPYEGFILIPGCDKNMPAAAMALLHMGLPGYIMSGGSIKPGIVKGVKRDIVDSYIAAGQAANNEITDEERREIQEGACPGSGACGGMYTANSMFTIFEAMGLSPLHSSSTLADDKAKECSHAHEILEDMIANGRTASHYFFIFNSFKFFSKCSSG